MLWCDISHDFWDYPEIFINKAFEFLTRKSLIVLVIQGVLLAFSLWDKNSRFFVILAAIGVYAVYMNSLIRDNFRRRLIAERRVGEARNRQYEIVRSRGTENFRELIFIPEEEISEDKGNMFFKGYLPILYKN